MVKALWDYRRTTLLTIAALVVLFVLVVWAYKNEWLIKRGPAPQAAEHPAVVHQSLPPTNLEQVRAWFGPWQLVDPLNAGTTALVLIRGDGGMEASSWTTKVDSQWHPTDIPQINQIEYLGGNVNFTLGGPTIYTVALGQPFVLEQLSDRVYAFVHNGGKYKIVSTTPRYVKTSGHKA